MKALRKICEHNRAALRLAVCVLALYTLLPVQLVWCHEDGPGPRLEASFHGICIPGAGGDCCSSTVQPHPDECCSGSDTPLLHQSCDHGHCIGCSDQPMHTQQNTSLARTLAVPLPKLSDAGLYTLTQNLDSTGCNRGQSALFDTGPPLPDLIELTTQTVLLLI